MKRVRVKTKILDVGCAESTYLGDLLDKRCEVWGIDIRSHDDPAWADKIRYIKSDIRFSATIPENYFDTVLCISTLEHIGLDHYDNKVMDPWAEPICFERMSRVLKEGGELILTCPFGKHEVLNWSKVYDWEFWISLLETTDLTLKVQQFRKLEEEKWISCSPEDLQNVEYDKENSRARGIVLAVLEKVKSNV